MTILNETLWYMHQMRQENTNILNKINSRQVTKHDILFKKKKEGQITQLNNPVWIQK